MTSHFSTWLESGTFLLFYRLTIPHKRRARFGSGWPDVPVYQGCQIFYWSRALLFGKLLAVKILIGALEHHRIRQRYRHIACHICFECSAQASTIERPQGREIARASLKVLHRPEQKASAHNSSFMSRRMSRACRSERQYLRWSSRVAISR